IPFPFIRRVQSTASAAPTSTFFGSHPRRAQVPPNGLESTIATCQPASLQRDATAEAPDPVPIAITSNFLGMFSSSILHLFRQAETLPRSASRLWHPSFRFTAQFRPANCLPHIGFAKLGSSAKNAENGWERINSFRHREGTQRCPISLSGITESSQHARSCLGRA